MRAPHYKPTQQLDRDLYLGILRERAALMEWTDEEVRDVYRKLDAMTTEQLRLVLHGRTIAELREGK